MEAMEAAGFMPDVHTYTALIGQLAKGASLTKWVLGYSVEKRYAHDGTVWDFVHRSRARFLSRAKA
jgi:hypothetical protein